MGQRFSRLAGNPRLGLASTRFNTNGNSPITVLHSSHHAEALCAAANDRIQLTAAKGAPAAQKKHGLEQAGLTGAIGSGNQRAMRMKFQLRVLEAPEIIDLKGQQRHGSPQALHWLSCLSSY